MKDEFVVLEMGPSMGLPLSSLCGIDSLDSCVASLLETELNVHGFLASMVDYDFGIRWLDTGQTKDTERRNGVQVGLLFTLLAGTTGNACKHYITTPGKTRKKLVETDVFTFVYGRLRV